MANLYKFATVFIYPSLYEGFGIPPLEAMHYGCPVLASNSSSIPEVVGSAGLYFDPTSTDDLVLQLEQLVSDDTLRQRLSLAGFQQEKLFSWDRCADQVFNFYKKVLGGL